MSTEIAIASYDSKNVAEFGNKFMTALVMQAVAEEEAAKLQASANEAKVFLSFEMTRAIFDLSDRHEDIDVYAVFGKAKDVEKLNTRVLVHMGVLKREINKDDEVVYNWTDENIKKLYEYTAELKESDTAEYNKRFNNRKKLNMRLSEAYKAVAALKDQGLKPGDLFYSENEAGEQVPTINNAPKEIAGDQKDGRVQLGSRKPIVGAQLSPTMSSLVKLAEKSHKADVKESRPDKGEDRSGVAKIGMTDEDFGAVVNTVKRAIIAQENQFSAEMIKHLKGLVEAASAAIATGVAKKK